MQFRNAARLLLALAMLVAGTLAGCAGAPAAPTAQPKPAAAPTIAPATPVPAPTSASGKIQLTDVVGRKVELPKSPERVVVVGQGAFMVLHTLYMFPEARPKIVATELRQASNGAFIDFIDPTFKQKGILEMNAGPEQIATYKPDLAIIKSTADVKLAAGLEQLGIPVVYVGLETPEMIYKDVENLGLVFGNPARAKAINAFYQDRVRKLADKTAGIDDKSKPRVLTIDYKDRSGQVAVSVAPEAWMQTIEVKLAGGAPVWTEASVGGSGWIVVNMEQVARWNADKVFVIAFLSPNPAEVIAKLKADAQWKDLKAVKSNEVYAYAQDIFAWDTPDTRWILGTMWMAKQIHPDRFKDIDLNQEVRAFFTELYGMDKASVDANIMPRLKTDIR